jgi:hypothetical protein
LTASAAALVLRYLPREANHEATPTTAAAAAEIAAELGLAGEVPVFATEA